MNLLDTVDQDSIEDMSREERLKMRSSLAKEAIKNNPKLRSAFAKADKDGRMAIKGRLYQHITKRVPELGRYKVGTRSRASYYQMWPGGTGEPVSKKEDVYGPLLDDSTEKMYDLIESGTMQPSELNEAEVAYFGQLAHMRSSPLKEEYQIRAREIYDKANMGEMGSFSDNPVGNIIEGMAAPLTDLARVIKEKKGENTSYYDQYKALEAVAYPNKVAWEKGGELGGLLVGSGIGYAALARMGLAKTVAKHGGQLAIRPQALASVGAMEFGLGAAYNTPSLVLQDGEPNRIVSGLEAAAIGSAFGLAVDAIRPMRGMTYQEAMEHTRRLTGEKFHDRLKRFQDQSKASTELRQRIDAARARKASGQQARSDYQAQARQDRLSRNELLRTGAAQQRSMDDIAEAKAAQERQAVATRKRDWDAAKAEEEAAARQELADEITKAMQAPSPGVARQADEMPTGQGVSTTEEYAKKVKTDNELVDVERRIATAKGRRGENRKELARLNSRREVLRANKVAQDLNPPLDRFEAMAEEAMPGSVLGINPYANIQNLSKAELQTLLMKEAAARTTAGVAGAATGDEDERLKRFLLGSLLWQGAFSRKAAGVGKLNPPRWLTDGWQSVKKGTAHELVPMLQRLKDNSPLAYNMVTAVRMGEMQDTARIGALAEPFFRTYRKAKSKMPWNRKYNMSKDQHEDLILALDNGDAVTRDRILNQVDPSGEWAKQWEGVVKANEYLHKRADQVKIDGLRYITDYFPRYVKDHKGLMDHKGLVRSHRYETALTEFKYKNGRSPNKMEVQELYSRVFREPSEFGAPANIKERQFTTLDKSDLKFYEDIDRAYGRYMQSMIGYINRRRGLGYTKNSLPFNAKRDILDNSIGDTINKITTGMRNNGIVDPDRVEEVHDLLRTSLVDYSSGPNAFWQGYRNLYYASMIGNPGSTVTQISDLGLAATKDPVATFNVVKNAALNLADAIKQADLKGAVQSQGVRKGVGKWWGEIKNPRKFNMNISDVGIQDIANDISNAGWTGKWLDFHTTASGFKMGDQLMKNIHLDSAFERLQKQARKNDPAYQSLQKERFGSDFRELDRALKRGDKDNIHVQHAAFNELVDVQPVIREALPERYSKMKNGRLVYSLKSFMLNHINFIRAHLIRNLNTAKTPAEYGKAWKELVTYGSIFGTTAFTANQVKDFIFGRDVTLSDAMVDAMWQTMGLSKYNIYQLRDIQGNFADERTWGTQALNILAPSKPVFSLLEDIDKGDFPMESSQHITPAGKLVYWNMLGGKRLMQKRRARAARSSVESFESDLGGGSFDSDLGDGGL